MLESLVVIIKTRTIIVCNSYICIISSLTSMHNVEKKCKFPIFWVKLVDICWVKLSIKF